MDSDHPHAEGVPTPRAVATEACAGLTAEQTAALMYRNATRFMQRVG